MLEQKNLSDLENQKLEKCASLLFLSVSNPNDPEHEHVILKSMCYEQLYFAYKHNEEFKNLEFDVNGEFYKNQVRLILMKKKLISVDRETIGINGIHVSDPRSLIANSVLNLYKEFNNPYAKGDPRVSLVPDLLDKTISQGVGIVRMFNLGLFSEAFSSWRTFHESLCIIKLLINGGEKARTAYLKHIVYSNAFRGGVEDEEERNHIFEVMKSEMKSHDLKSKDMKKYIEYGWLYSLDIYDESNPDFKLNFRDGIQRCANLRDYSEWYEAASELSHSSAIFFYSESEYFTNLTIHGFYDMLEVLDEIVCSYYAKIIESLDENMKKNFSILEGEFHTMILEQRNYFNYKYFDGVDPNVHN